MSEREPIISVRALSKAYTIYERPRDIFKEVIFGGVRHDVFWALKDVNFDVFEGERVGIVGPNGAGKSTLLQLVTGNLTPTSGTVTVQGTVSAMLSLTSFLNPDESGLENVRFNLLLSGVEKRDVPRLTDEIAEFAELGGFIHAPVRTYSSGMNARLAFSIATVVTPDVLVVDEVLGVGDAYFSAKAMMRMIELSNQGRALLFVSHATSAIQLLCNRAIWLDTGGVRAIGPVDEIIKAYEADFRREEDERIRPGNIARSKQLRGRIQPQEISVEGAIRLRLTSHSGRLSDTHYLRRIEVGTATMTADVSLFAESLDDPDVRACLDLVHTEWGRVHTRKGSESRALAPSSRPLRGGHVLVKSASDEGGSLEVTVTIESTSIGGRERLKLQVADLESGDWIDVAQVSEAQTRDGWTLSVFSGVVTVPPRSVALDALERIVGESRPDVEVDDVAILVNGERTHVVRERQPFALCVGLRANRLVPRVDVGVKFARVDGVYVFWQSSGQVGGNLVDVEGEWDVIFHFDPNLFGGGEYDISIDVGNGFDIERNFPYSQIYDRRVNATRVAVDREWKILDTGPLNYRFPVDVRRRSDDRADSTRPVELRGF